MEFPALKYLRLRMSGPADEDTVRNGRQLFKCICSGSDALLSVSIDISMPRRNCRASEEFAVWIARVHGRTMKSLYLDYLTLGEDCIHRVLSSCPQLECFGFTPLWRLMDLVRKCHSRANCSLLIGSNTRLFTFRFIPQGHLPHGCEVIFGSPGVLGASAELSAYQTSSAEDQKWSFH